MKKDELDMAVVFAGMLVVILLVLAIGLGLALTQGKKDKATEDRFEIDVRDVQVADTALVDAAEDFLGETKELKAMFEVKKER